MQTITVPVLRKREAAQEIKITNAPSSLAELGRMAGLRDEPLLNLAMSPFIQMAKDLILPGESVDFAVLVARSAKITERKRERELQRFYPQIYGAVQAAKAE